ncbi:undecaprenyl-diphosphate phosphatase, partial [Candidatus Fermentibacterales bacterium]|nr:undecaprenyl-diphosphate phosphatase [Candidatus Fermentibacterales bacterium]
MSWLEAAALGALQGLTEFLPVSSSGHLVLGRAMLGIPPGGVTFEVVVHLGTMAAILMVFGRDLLSLLSGAARLEATSLRMLGVLAAASVPAALAGLLLRSSIEGLFGSPVLVSVMLLVTGTLLWITRFAPRADVPIAPRADVPAPGPAHGECSPGFSRGLAIGVAQAVAIIPGISRSGATIAAGLMVGVERRAAAEFSFLLAIPAIAGAALLDLPESDLLA